MAINPNTGVILEFDHRSDTEPCPTGSSARAATYIKFKDPDEVKSGDEVQEGITSDKINVLKSRLANFENVLYSSTLHETGTSTWT